DAVVSLPPAETPVPAVVAPDPVPAAIPARVEIPEKPTPPAPAAKPVPATAEKPVAKPVIAPQAQEKKAASPPAPTAQAMPAMALATLEQRLKDTNAIGIFTKIALKNQVDDLVSRVRAHHDGPGNATLSQLRQAYDQLLARVHGLLKDGDPALANAIMASRESIWVVLMDPVKFAKL
ncbi:MAG: hypothetical protein Q8R21_05060, partial [Burkholderiales bacterium]|nr:hypothetical protein [Burkholderiales bacterium]